MSAAATHLLLTFNPPRDVRVRRETPEGRFVCEWAAEYPGGAKPGDIIVRDIPAHELSQMPLQADAAGLDLRA